MAISVVQFAHGSRTSSGTITVTLGSNASAGNLLLCFCCESGLGSSDSTHTPAHQTDSFSKVAAWNGGSGNPKIALWGATILGGNTSKTVTMSPSAATGGALLVYEVTNTSKLTDGIACATGASSPVSSGSFTTANNNDLLLGMGCAVAQSSGASFTAHSSPWTSEVNQTSTASVWGYSSAYQILSSTGSQSWSQTCTPNGESIAVALVALKEALAPPANTVAPAVTGTTTVGQTLTSDTGTWTNNGTPVYTYQWQRDNFGSGGYTNIGGQVSDTYTLVDADDACHIRCVVTNTDVWGAVSANSNAVGTVIEPQPANTVAPVASGFGYQGQTLTVTTGTWSHMAGHTHTFTYQWQRDNSGGGSYSNIGSATASSYVLTSSDLGDNVRCVVTADNSNSTNVAANSNAVGLVQAPPALPSNSVAPLVTGTVDIDFTLSCDTGTWTGAVDTYTYQWQRDTAYDNSFSDIATATASTYVLTEADAGNGIRCEVTATNISGSTSADSNVMVWPDFYLAAQIQFGDTFTALGLDRPAGSLVQSAKITRGRATSLDQVAAGTCTLQFRNDSGDLDPTNAAGPWFGQILPLIQCRVRRRFNGHSIWLFNGRVERWLPHWLQPSFQTMQVPAVDAFERLNTTDLVSGIATLTTALTGSNNDLLFTAVEAGELGDQISVTYAVAGNNTSLDTGTNSPVSGSAVFKTTPLNRSKGVSRLGLGGIGQVPTAPPSSVEVQGTDITVTVATDGGGAPTSTASQVMAAMNANANVAKLVTVSLAPANTGAGVVTAMAQTFLTGGKWPQELSGDRISRVLDTVGWDASLRAIDPGTVQVVTKGFSVRDNASALQHMQNVADAEFGYVFVSADGVFTFHDANHRTTATRSTVSQATFADDTGFSYQAINPSLDKDKVFNRASVQAAGEPQTADDTYSQTGTGTPPAWATQVPSGGFGVRALSTRTTELADDADALAQANAIVTAYAYPKVRFDQIITLEPGGYEGHGSGTTHDSWVTQVLALEIGDRVTVRTTPPGTSTTSQFDAFVEQITDEVTVGQAWKRTLQVTAVTQTIAGGGGGGGGGTTGGAMLNVLGNDLILDDPIEGVIGT